MTDPFQWIADELNTLSERALLRPRRNVTHLDQGKCRLDGRLLWNFSGNDYLGLSRHPEILSAAQSAIQEGLGAGASPLVSGRTHWHVALEEQLARFKGSESAILFPTGFAANFGAITTLVGREDVVFCDRLNHASLIDGARHSQARLRVYPHRDLSVLEKELEKAETYRRKLIITDSLFSMDGDLAPLAELTQLAERHAAMLLIDEAHATGVFGPTGAGLAEELQIHSRHLVSVGTLSKAIGAQGGFVAGSQAVCDLLWNQARTSMFSTALAPVLCAGANRAISLIPAMTDRREWIIQKSQRVQNALRNLGWTIPEEICGPIIPIIIGTPEKTLTIAAQLQELGILVAAIRPPTVPPKTSRLRISLSFAHSEEGVSALIDAFGQIS